MSKYGDAFNRSGLSRFLNTPAGRLFRIVAGIAFIALGIAYRHNVLGLLSIVWGALGLTAGTLDICFISVVLGGPLSGKVIRERYRSA